MRAGAVALLPQPRIFRSVNRIALLLFVSLPCLAGCDALQTQATWPHPSRSDTSAPTTAHGRSRVFKAAFVYCERTIPAGISAVEAGAEWPATNPQAWVDGCNAGIRRWSERRGVAVVGKVRLASNGATG
jgi:hypothetical protein